MPRSQRRHPRELHSRWDERGPATAEISTSRYSPAWVMWSVTLPHRRAGVRQVGHDLPQPPRPGSHGDVHRMHNIGKRHGDLRILGRSSRLVEVYRARYRTWPPGWTARRRNRRPTLSGSVHRHHPGGVHANIVSLPGQRCPSYRHANGATTETKFRDSQMWSLSRQGIDRLSPTILI